MNDNISYTGSFIAMIYVVEAFCLSVLLRNGDIQISHGVVCNAV